MKINKLVHMNKIMIFNNRNLKNPLQNQKYLMSSVCPYNFRVVKCI